MPIYEFTCGACGFKKEVIQTFTEPSPECCGKPMRRGFGGMSYWQWKDDPNGSTPGIRKYAQELTQKLSK